MVILHFQISVCLHFYLTISFQNTDIPKWFLTAHAGIILPVTNRNMTNLTVILTPRNMVGCSSYNYAIARCDRLHFIVFAPISQELPRNQRLENVSVQLRTDIICLSLFILCNIICILQILDKLSDLCMFFNLIILSGDGPKSVFHQFIPEMYPDINLINITMLIDQLFQCICRCILIIHDTAYHECFCNIILTYRFPCHTHQEF